MMNNKPLQEWNRRMKELRACTCDDFKKEVALGIHIKWGGEGKAFYLVGIQDTIDERGIHYEKVYRRFTNCPFCGLKVKGG